MRESSEGRFSVGLTDVDALKAWQWLLWYGSGAELVAPTKAQDTKISEAIQHLRHSCISHCSAIGEVQHFNVETVLCSSHQVFIR